MSKAKRNAIDGLCNHIADLIADQVEMGERLDPFERDEWQDRLEAAIDEGMNRTEIH
jgi:hypothetical protein